jgi:hypothetical protein
MNQDGTLDIVATICNKGCTENGIGILMGDGYGHFTLNELHHVQGVPYNILSGNFLSKNSIDIAASDYPNGSLMILQNLHGENFSQEVRPSGSKTIALVAGDLTNNGREDLILANHGSATITVFIALEDDLSDPIITHVPSLPYSIAVANLDNDSFFDLLVAHSSSPGVLSAWRGLGNGQFELISEIETADRLIFVAAADVNGDGLDDAVVTHHQARAATVYLNTGIGIFNPLSQVTMESENEIYAAAVGDINHDGLPDLLTVDFNANTLSVALGRSIDDMH